MTLKDVLSSPTSFPQPSPIRAPRTPKTPAGTLPTDKHMNTRPPSVKASLSMEEQSQSAKALASQNLMNPFSVGGSNQPQTPLPPQTTSQVSIRILQLYLLPAHNSWKLRFAYYSSLCLYSCLNCSPSAVIVQRLQCTRSKHSSVVHWQSDRTAANVAAVQYTYRLHQASSSPRESRRGWRAHHQLLVYLCRISGLVSLLSCAFHVDLFLLVDQPVVCSGISLPLVCYQTTERVATHKCYMETCDGPWELMLCTNTIHLSDFLIYIYPRIWLQMRLLQRITVKLYSN